MLGAAQWGLGRTVAAFSSDESDVPYRPAGVTPAPEVFFRLDSAPPPLRTEAVRRFWLGIGLGHGLRRRFAFDSAAPCGDERNDTVRGYWLTPLRHEVRASILYVHGWQLTSLRPLVRDLAPALDQGVEVLVPALPGHLWRRPRHAGPLLLSPDLDRSLRAVRQAVLDVRCLLSWLQRRDLGPVLLAGTDLGGVVAALAAAAHEGVEALALIAPAASLADLVWAGSIDRGRTRDVLVAAGSDKAALDEAWSVLDPAGQRPLVKPGKVLMVTDRPAEAASRPGIAHLLESWGGGRIACIPRTRRVVAELVALIDPVKEEQTDDGR